MKRMLAYALRLHREELGHAVLGFTSLIPAIGAIVLTVGVTSDEDTITWIGGILLGVGLFVAGAARHRGVDYEVYSRLETLEKPD
jgi:hypothetical protein